MTAKEIIQHSQDSINGVPCKYCGKQHHVDIVNNGTELRPVVSCSFSDDTCDSFKHAVYSYVSHMLHDKGGYPITSL